jgi:plasmid maintenance system antidote protein VapI
LIGGFFGFKVEIMLKRGLPPAHSGEILKDMFIVERKLTVTEVAKGLKWQELTCRQLLTAIWE